MRCGARKARHAQSSLFHGTAVWLVSFSTRQLIVPRFVLLLTERRDYFFYLYVVGVAGQLWLTLLALLHYPDAQHMEPVPGSDEAAYEVGRDS